LYALSNDGSDGFGCKSRLWRLGRANNDDLIIDDEEDIVEKTTHLAEQ
jgi:hypothetical protein